LRFSTRHFRSSNSRLLPPAQHRAHARRELPQAEGLCHIVVGAEIEPRDAVHFVGPRRHHDDRQVARVRPRSQDAAHLEAAQDREIQVEDDQVGRVVDDGLQRRVARAHELDARVAVALEGMLDEPADVLFIFNDENPRRLRDGLERRDRLCVGAVGEAGRVRLFHGMIS
jgi:hypothetical protein